MGFTDVIFAGFALYLVIGSVVYYLVKLKRISGLRRMDKVMSVDQLIASDRTVTAIIDLHFNGSEIWAVFSDGTKIREQDGQVVFSEGVLIYPKPTQSMIDTLCTRHGCSYGRPKFVKREKESNDNSLSG